MGSRRPRSGAGVRLASSLHQFWKTRGYGTEGRRWTDRALAADAELEPRIEIKLLKAVAVMLESRATARPTETQRCDACSLHASSGTNERWRDA